MPGTASISSGYTSQLITNAIQCDQARVLARLQTSPCIPSVKSTSWAPASSVLERKAQTECGKPVEGVSYPRIATTSGAYTLSQQGNTLRCSEKFFRFIPPKCCPPTPTNNPQKPTNQPGCTPSRFF